MQNIGYERPKELNLYFIIDDEGGGSFVINYGVAAGGKATLDITSTNLAGLPEISFYVKDDATEGATWNVTTGSMTEATWMWSHSGTDGGVLGYLPLEGYCMQLMWQNLEEINAINIASFNDLSHDLSFVTVETEFAMGGGIEACAKLCTDACSIFLSQTTCINDGQGACAWCNGTCTPDSNRNGHGDDCDPCPYSVAC